MLSLRANTGGGHVSVEGDHRWVLIFGWDGIKASQAIFCELAHGTELS